MNGSRKLSTAVIKVIVTQNFYMNSSSAIPVSPTDHSMPRTVRDEWAATSSGGVVKVTKGDGEEDSGSEMGILLEEEYSLGSVDEEEVNEEDEGDDEEVGDGEKAGDDEEGHNSEEESDEEELSDFDLGPLLEDPEDTDQQSSDVEDAETELDTSDARPLASAQDYDPYNEDTYAAQRRTLSGPTPALSADSSSGDSEIESDTESDPYNPKPRLTAGEKGKARVEVKAKAKGNKDKAPAKGPTPTKGKSTSATLPTPPATTLRPQTSGLRLPPPASSSTFRASPHSLPHPGLNLDLDIETLAALRAEGFHIPSTASARPAYRGPKAYTDEMIARTNLVNEHGVVQILPLFAIREVLEKRGEAAPKEVVVVEVRLGEEHGDWEVGESGTGEV